MIHNTDIHAFTLRYRKVYSPSLELPTQLYKIKAFTNLKHLAIAL